MAVPSSGPISLRGLAREKIYDDYNNAGTPTVISLTNLATGVGYDATNTSSPSYPNTSLPHGMSEWYSYDHNYTAGVTVWSVSMTLTGKNTATLACEEWNYGGTKLTRYITGGDSIITNGDVVYTNTPGTTLFNGGGLYYADATYTFQISSVGVISNRAVQFC